MQLHGLVGVRPSMQLGIPGCKIRAKPSKKGQAWGSTFTGGLAPGHLDRFSHLRILQVWANQSG